MRLNMRAHWWIRCVLRPARIHKRQIDRFSRFYAVHDRQFL